MGVGELMASVVSGIEIPAGAASVALFAMGGVLTAGAAACGAAAVGSSGS